MIFKRLHSGTPRLTEGGGGCQPVIFFSLFFFNFGFGNNRLLIAELVLQKLNSSKSFFASAVQSR